MNNSINKPINKLNLDDDKLKQLYSVKKRLKGFRFNRYVGLSWRSSKKVENVWRKPRGNSNKLKLCEKGKGVLVRIGYGTPKVLRNKINGFDSKIIITEKDLMDVIANYKYCILSRKLGDLKKIIYSSILKSYGIIVKNYLPLSSSKNIDYVKTIITATKNKLNLTKLESTN